MKVIELSCTNCSSHFEIPLNEYKRQIKKGRDYFFCSRSCSAIKSNKDNPRPGNPENLIADNKRDDFTPFRWFVNRGNFRSKTKKRYDCNLTVEFLKTLWEKQNEICPFTGWRLILPKDSSYPWDENHPANASLDRIDNSKGYIQGNVRFVSVMFNLARQVFSDDQVINFCKSVAQFKDLK